MRILITCETGQEELAVLDQIRLLVSRLPNPANFEILTDAPHLDLVSVLVDLSELKRIFSGFQENHGGVFPCDLVEICEICIRGFQSIVASKQKDTK